jgi:hypothetical protein
MSPILFSQNDKPIAVFDDKKIFKTKSFHYILDSLIKRGYFKTKKQCGMKIKEDLKLLFEEGDYSFIYKDMKFCKQIFEMNDLQIVKEEKCVLESNIYIVYNLQDINSPIEMLDVTDLYNKNE